MTNEELLVKARDGCKESENVLYEQTKKLIYKITNYFHDKNPIEELEELRAIGMLGWARAYKNYNLNSGNKFSTYLYKCVRVELLNHFYSQSLQKRDHRHIVYVYFNESVEDETEGTYEDMLELPNKYGEFELKFNSLLIRQEVENAVDALLERKDVSQFHYDVFKKHLIDDISGVELGERLSVSRQRINQIVRQVALLIKKELNKIGYNYSLFIA